MARIDAVHSEDPTTVECAGRSVAAELLYAERMSEWLSALYPDASEALQLAVRAQHLARWRLPRSDFPDGRAGYKRWRSRLMELHAEETGGHLRDVGYGEDTVARVETLIRKRGLRTDTEAQALEDVACLVFLQHYFADFSRKHRRAKVIDIVRKTWKKMSQRARDAALSVELPDEEAQLLAEALG